MARSKELIAIRNKKIYQRFKELYDKKFGTVRLYTYEAILNMLSEEFYLDPASFPRILKEEEEKEKESSKVAVE